jgi:hypothetical protein
MTSLSRLDPKLREAVERCDEDRAAAVGSGSRIVSIFGYDYDILRTALLSLSERGEAVAFAEWFARECPEGTIIGNPAWWAERIARRFAHPAPKPAPTLQSASNPAETLSKPASEPVVMAGYTLPSFDEWVQAMEGLIELADEAMTRANRRGNDEYDNDAELAEARGLIGVMRTAVESLASIKPSPEPPEPASGVGAGISESDEYAAVVRSTSHIGQSLREVIARFIERQAADLKRVEGERDRLTMGYDTLSRTLASAERQRDELAGLLREARTVLDNVEDEAADDGDGRVDTWKSPGLHDLCARIDRAIAPKVEPAPGSPT